MSRKPAPSVKDWKPSPECDEAFGRILEVAHRSAAAYLGQKPVADPIRDASLVALTHASAMIYFLFRVDPKDLALALKGMRDEVRDKVMSNLSSRAAETLDEDIALLGSPILGHVIADRSGHEVHRAFMQAIIDNPQCWEYVTFRKRGASLRRQAVRATQTSEPRFAPFFAPVGEVLAARTVCAV